MSSNINQEEDQFSIQEELNKYLIHWKWFLLSVFVFICLAFLYLRYSTPIYKTTSTILIKDDNEGRGLSELAAFGDIGLSGLGSTDIDDETEILKSNSILSKVVTDLGIHVTQIHEGNIKHTDIYNKSPLNISFKRYLDKDSIPLKDNTLEKEVKILSDTSYELIDQELEAIEKYNFGDKIILEQGVLTIDKSSTFISNSRSEEPIKTIKVFISTITAYVASLQRGISIEPKSKRSSVVDLSMKVANKKKGRDILNGLVAQYNQEAIDDKNLVSKNTANFISERLKIISGELDSVEVEKAVFKKGNKLTDIDAEAEVFIGEISQSQTKILAVETQLALTKSMIGYLSDTSRISDLLPANVGIESSNVNNSISEYNKLVLDRDRLLANSTELNPLVVDLNANIRSLRQNLSAALNNQKNNYQITIKDLNRQKGKINSKITSIPQKEKDYRGILRQQNIKESLYLFLLKKREETSISLAVTAPVAKVLDRAYNSVRAVSPKRKIIFLASMLIGLLIPFGFIYVKDLLDTKIHSKVEVDQITNGITVLAELPSIKKNTTDTIQINDRSPLGESFRILRTNLSYFSKNKNEEGKALKIFVTSTIKGEGKTFVSYNTCLSLAESGRKVLIIGADIRNPQLHRFEDQKMKKALGLSEYLYDESLQFDDIKNSVVHENREVDIVFSGHIAPNPSELLSNGRLDKLVASAEDYYDYIIIDTAPTMVVTDTLLISKLADVTLYVIRADYTDKRLLEYPKQLKKDKKIKGLAFVLNDVKENNLGFGTKYSYGYGEETELKWYQKIFKRG